MMTQAVVSKMRRAVDVKLGADHVTHDSSHIFPSSCTDPYNLAPLLSVKVLLDEVPRKPLTYLTGA